MGRKTVTYKGKTYQSLVDLAEECDVPVGRIRQRLGRGWSLEDAIEKPPKTSNHPIPIKDHMGNEYESKNKLLSHYGLSLSTFESRLKCGWSLEDALTTPSDCTKTSIIDKDLHILYLKLVGEIDDYYE